VLGHVTSVGNTEIHTVILSGNVKGRWEDNTEMGFRETGNEVVD
jgi:hypothetical protein